MLLLAASILLSLAALAQSALKIPARPADHSFIYDTTGTLQGEDEIDLKELQQAAFANHDTPIVVVVIDRMAAYGTASGIESFTQTWFDEWGIGSEDPNTGILLLVSLQDRRARIELGADWGRKWDEHCQGIMNDQIVPKFKKNRYPDGIIQGVRSLAEMAALGPEAEPPGQGWGETFNDSLEKASALSVFEPTLMAMLVGLSFALFAAAFFLPGQREMLVKGGIAIIVLAVFSYVVIGLIAVVFGGGKGGGFSGGFSGGGGASGSW